MPSYLVLRAKTKLDIILENFELKGEKKSAEDPFTFSHLEKIKLQIMIGND